MQNDTITRPYGAHIDYTSQTQSYSIDWEVIAEITPLLFTVFTWLLWLSFLLAPTLFGLHYTTLFSTANNVVFTLMGLVLCVAITVAISSGHGFRAVFLGLGLALLSYWF